VRICAPVPSHLHLGELTGFLVKEHAVNKIEFRNMTWYQLSLLLSRKTFLFTRLFVNTTLFIEYLGKKQLSKKIIANICKFALLPTLGQYFLIGLFRTSKYMWDLESAKLFKLI